MLSRGITALRLLFRYACNDARVVQVHGRAVLPIWRNVRICNSVNYQYRILDPFWILAQYESIRDVVERPLKENYHVERFAGIQQGIKISQVELRCGTSNCRCLSRSLLFARHRRGNKRERPDARTFSHRNEFLSQKTFSYVNVSSAGRMIKSCSGNFSDEKTLITLPASLSRAKVQRIGAPVD